MQNIHIKPLIRRILKALSSILSSILLITNLIPNTSYALSTDESKPITINSDQFSANLKNHTAEYLNNVTATQGSRSLFGDSANIYATKNNEIIKIIILGKPAKYSYLPDDSDKLAHASADTITYQPPKNLFILTGNAKIKQDGNIYTGYQLSYNTIDETITSPAKQYQRGKMILQPNLFDPKKQTKKQTK